MITEADEQCQLTKRFINILSLFQDSMIFSFLGYNHIITARKNSFRRAFRIQAVTAYMIIEKQVSGNFKTRNGWHFCLKETTLWRLGVRALSSQQKTKIPIFIGIFLLEKMK